MTTPAAELAQLLTQIRGLDGWTCTHLGSGAHRVTSPQGSTTVPGPPVTDELVLGVLDQLDQLGFGRDLRAQPARTQARIDAAAAAAATTSIPDFVLADHRKHEDSHVPKTDDGLLRLTVRHALPDVTRNNGRRYSKEGVVLTPAIATAFKELIDPDHNRNERPTNRRNFKNIILARKWRYTHQGLAFNVNGRMSDGQHRVLGYLDAIAENPDIIDDPDYQVVVDITYNLPVEAAFGMDGGQGRNLRDHAAVHGVEGSAKTTPLVQLLRKYKLASDKPWTWKDLPTIPPDEIGPMTDKYGGEVLVEGTATARRVLNGSKPIRSARPNFTAVGVFYYLAKEAWDGHDADGKPWKTHVVVNGEGVEEEVPLHPVDDFLDAVAEDTRRVKLSPQRALNSWLIGISRDNKKATPQTYLAMFIVAYNDFCTGGERHNMAWRPNSGIPEAYAPEAYVPE